MISYVLNVLFSIYSFMLIVRIFSSWFPSWQNQSWMLLLSRYTDPYLNIFRQFLPPIGGLDLSPLLAFFCLQIIEWLLNYFLLRF